MRNIYIYAYVYMPRFARISTANMYVYIYIYVCMHIFARICARSLSPASRPGAPPPPAVWEAAEAEEAAEAAEVEDPRDVLAARIGAVHIGVHRV